MNPSRKDSCPAGAEQRLRELAINLPEPPEPLGTWQAWMQKAQPRVLVIWGKNDFSFDPGEPERFRKDVSKAEVHVLEAGHFALDTKADDIAVLVKTFMN